MIETVQKFCENFDKVTKTEMERGALMNAMLLSDFDDGSVR